jgi:hypothetical protein
MRRKKKSILIGCIVRAVRRRWLEYETASALRTPLAGLSKFVAAVGNGKNNESLPSAANPSVFRTRVRPQPSEVTPACSTSMGNHGNAAVLR